MKSLLTCFLLLVSIASAATIYPVPEEVRSQVFAASIDGHAAAVTHAATTYHFLNFEIHGNTEITVVAPSDDYWSRGIEVQPWRLNIRPTINGRTATFHLAQPAKLSITRPGDHLAGAEMLFVFANEPEAGALRPNSPNVRYFGPGVYHQSIDAKSGETIYLAAGAVVFGSLNIWGVEHVKVFGRGTLIYDGPQNPVADEGWMHRKDWHVIVTDHARDIEISGITCVVRSRTWMIQMLESRNITFDNVKVIGGCPGNANQDGMDWLGGGDTVVRDCFFRASDDIFALYGNWLGYSEAQLRTPGPDVTNIRIERCVLSTSISNVVRVSWPKKVFNSHHFEMVDSDVIHMGVGGCGIPFALFEFWNDQGGEGQHSDYRFENIRLEDWYSLAQIRAPKSSVRNVTFRNIWMLEQPALVPSQTLGNVQGIGSESGSTVRTVFEAPPGLIAPGSEVVFDAGGSTSSNRIRSYEWFFGDGTQASGMRVKHAFPDSQGTLRDGSGRFRVLLKVTAVNGDVDWTYRPVVIAGPARPQARTEAYNFRYDSTLTVPADGGYVFWLAARDHGRLLVDGVEAIALPSPVKQVCGLAGNAVRGAWGAAALKAGKHTMRLDLEQPKTTDGFTLQWQGPGMPLRDIDVPSDASSGDDAPHAPKP